MPYANYADSLANAKKRYNDNPSYFAEKAAIWRMENRRRKCWLDQRATSKRRGVEFNLTFEEYKEFWGEDFCNKGRNAKDLCMGRYGDTGPYEVGNIYQCTNAENKQGARSKP